MLAITSNMKTMVPPRSLALTCTNDCSVIAPKTASIPLLNEDSNADAVQSKAGIPIQPAPELYANKVWTSFNINDTAPEPDSPIGKSVDKNTSKDGIND